VIKYMHKVLLMGGMLPSDVVQTKCNKSVSQLSSFTIDKTMLIEVRSVSRNWFSLLVTKLSVSRKI